MNNSNIPDPVLKNIHRFTGTKLAVRQLNSYINSRTCHPTRSRYLEEPNPDQSCSIGSMEDGCCVADEDFLINIDTLLLHTTGINKKAYKNDAPGIEKIPLVFRDVARWVRNRRPERAFYIPGRGVVTLTRGDKNNDKLIRLFLKTVGKTPGFTSLHSGLHLFEKASRDSEDLISRCTSNFWWIDEDSEEITRVLKEHTDLFYPVFEAVSTPAIVQPFPWKKVFRSEVRRCAHGEERLTDANANAEENHQDYYGLNIGALPSVISDTRFGFQLNDGVTLGEQIYHHTGMFKNDETFKDVMIKILLAISNRRLDHIKIKFMSVHGSTQYDFPGYTAMPEINEVNFRIIMEGIWDEFVTDSSILARTVSWRPGGKKVYVRNSRREIIKAQIEGHVFMLGKMT